MGMRMDIKDRETEIRLHYKPENSSPFQIRITIRDSALAKLELIDSDGNTFTFEEEEAIKFIGFLQRFVLQVKKVNEM